MHYITVNSISYDEAENAIKELKDKMTTDLDQIPRLHTNFCWSYMWAVQYSIACIDVAKVTNSNQVDVVHTEFSK